MSSTIPARPRFRKPFAEKNNETFTIIFDSIDVIGLKGTVESTFRKLKRAIRMCGGQCDWPIRRLAAYCGLPEGTYRDHFRQIKAVGLIEAEERRIYGCRQNLTNILRLNEGGSKIQPQKRTEKDLKTKAPTREKPRVEITPAKPEPEHPPAPVQPSKARLEWEARREWDRECTRRMLASYEAVGRAMVTEQAERQECRERNRRWWREGERHRWDGGREHRRDQARQRCSQAQAESSALSYWERPDVIARIAKQDEDYLREMGALSNNEHKVNTL
jgi:hypothetical protein